MYHTIIGGVAAGLAGYDITQNTIGVFVISFVLMEIGQIVGTAYYLLRSIVCLYEARFDAIL